MSTPLPDQPESDLSIEGAASKTLPGSSPAATERDLLDRVWSLSPTEQTALRPKLSVGPSRMSSTAKNQDCSVFTEKEAPLSFAQEQMWLLEKLEPNSPVYNRPANLRFRGPLDAKALERSLNELVRRHEVLRMRICNRNCLLTQRTMAFEPFALPVLQLAPAPGETIDGQLQSLADEEGRKLFDLENEPPFRAALIRIAPNDHALLLTLHHTAFDDWSLAILWEDLAAGYRAFRVGQLPDLPELPIQYGEFATGQRERLEGDVLSCQLAYWKNKLAGYSGVSDLPVDRPPPAISSSLSGSVVHPLPADLSSALQEVSLSERATLSMTLLAGLAALLHRLTRQSELVIGVPVAGRALPETERVIGCFINTLAIRIDLSGNPTVSELLQRVRSESLEAFAHQEIPFERVVAALSETDDSNRSRLCRTLFQLRNPPRNAVEWPELSVEPMAVCTNVAKTDLNFEIVETRPGLTLECKYSIDLFERSTIERWLGSFEVLLRAMVAHPRFRLGELPLLTEVQRHQILVEWNRTEREYPRDKCVHQLIEEQVERTPDEVAVVYEEQSLTYRELEIRSNQLANYLRGLGAGPESLVALCLERSLEMVVAICGTLKAGAAYVPIDPAYPADRSAFMIADANAPVILTQELLRDKLPSTTARVIFLDSGWEIIGRECQTAPASGVQANNLAYVIYTSGSTGKPKGVMNTHRAVVNRLLWMQDSYRLSAPDAVMQKTPFSFDVSVWEFFWPLLAGVRLVVARPEGHRDGGYLTRLIASQQITTLHFVPSMLRHFLEEAEVTRCATLRQVICSGEALPWDLQETFFDRLPGVALHNLYGPTEAAVDVTHWTCNRETNLRIIPIGRPIANTQIYILDEVRQPVPVGVPGELYIGGVGVARGYHNRPELTQEKFVEDSFSSQPDARLFRTGDLARYLPDGNIEFLGRIDHQVKIRGFRIELGEIESVLRENPSLSSCAVLARRDGAKEMGLVAFVVARDARPLLVEALREWLAQKLPQYMIPARFVVINALPLAPNGKLDRKALEKMEGLPVTLATKYLAPRHDLERHFVVIWQEVLRREKVGIRDDFFELGGHSLLAMKLVSQIASVLRLQVPLRWIFEHRTVESLCQQIQSDQVQTRPFVSIELADRQPVAPMSYGQRRMWLVDQALSNRATYNQPLVYRFRGMVDVGRLRDCLAVLMNRHEVLRTALVQEGKDLMQRITPVGGLAVPWMERDLRAARAEQTEALAMEQLSVEVRRPFDLGRAPLWRVFWMTVTENEHILALTFHHSLVDEWSLRLFLKECEQLYSPGCGIELDILPKLPVQYVDYAVSQERRLTEFRLERLRAYWTEQLKDFPPALELPVDALRPARPSGRGSVHRFHLSGEVVSGLRDLARREGTSLFSLMLAAFQVWLHRWSGQTDIVVGTPVADREDAEVQALIGFFLNTVPIRTRLNPLLSFVDVLGAVRETVIEALIHADLPFEQIIETVAKRPLGTQSPLFQVMFVLLEEGLPKWGLGQVEAEPILVNTGTSKIDLLLNITAANAEWVCELEYATDLFTPEGAGRVEAQFTELLQSIVAHPESPVSQLNLVRPEERHRLLVEWNRTHRDYAQDKCVHQLFEEQAERTPDAVAVVFDGESSTYRELNVRANRLSHHLRRLGVGPDVPVGLCLERSMEMLVGLLGVLKAGGPYVPLDPQLPPERLEFLKDDAACTVVITKKALRPLFRQGLEAKSLAVTWVILDEMTSASLAEEELNPVAGAAPHHLAYVLYTSGSTGQPKGVEMPHRGLVNLLNWQCLNSAATIGSRTLQFASFGFDVSFQEIFSTWLSGGTLVLVADQTRFEPAALLAAITRLKIQRIFLPFAVLERLAEAAMSQNVLPSDLKEVLVAGEQLRIGPDLRGFFVRMPGCRLWNQYGPTESHVVTSYELVGPPNEWPDLPLIGRPLANCQVYLLDAQLLPVPVGSIGDLYVGGVCLARGYRRRPELTAERFIPNPFSPEPGAQLYKTGDLARYRSDGDLEYIGRADHQVKIRGHRVEPSEIESVLARHPEVASCVVIARDHGNGKRTLVSFVVCRRDKRPSVGSLRRFLAEKLPDYMIPTRFCVLSELPMTPNGKVERKALEKLEGIELPSSIDFVVPRNETECALAEVWQKVLGRESVGIRDNLFELGGHSLLAAVISSQIALRFNLEIPLRWIFEHPTIEGLARQLETLGKQFHNHHSIGTTGRQQPLPASFGQQQMWLLHQTLPDRAAYNQAVAWRLSGHVDGERVRRSLYLILERHEVLRTALVQQGQELLQQVVAAKDFPFPWMEVDLQSVPPDERPSALEDRLLEEARRPFDLAEVPLWRAAWFKLAEGEHVLGITFHHCIMDEWSLRLFVLELAGAYAADGQAESADLLRLPIQYADYALWQRQALSEEILDRQRAYWKEQLSNLPAILELPSDRARPLRPSGQGAVHRFRLCGDVPRKFRELAREEGTTVLTVLLAAFQAWLHRYTGQTDVVVGTPMANRERPEVQQLIGYFLNTLPIRTRLAANGSFRTLVQQVRETLLGAFSNANLPFEQMVKLSVQERPSGEQPLFQVMFVLLEEGTGALNLGQAQSRIVPMETRTSKSDLILSIQATGQDWECRLDYATDLFGAESAARMAGHLAELLRSITNDPGQSLSRLQLMSEAERHQILIEWNRTEREYPRDQCVHQLFAEQAQRTPDAVALVFEKQRLSYGELNEKANRLAQHLCLLGVDPGDFVGLRVERSFDMVIGLLGILKAGAAYWATEDNLPDARFQLLLHQAQPRVVLVRRSSLSHFARLASEARVASPGRTLTVAALEDLSGSPQDKAITPAVLCQAGDPAYVTYTSGSTGQPKGVVVPHRGIVRLVRGADYVSLSAQETLLHLSPLAFDASTFELWGALLNGGTVVLMPPGPPALLNIGRTIREQGVTTLWLTAGLFHLMVDECLDELRPLRQLLSGGDVLSPEHVAKARRSLPGCRIINGYGPSENTTFTCCYSVTDEADLSPSVPIGRPIANTQVYVLDPYLQPVPVGVTGELYTGGDGVASGYLHQRQLTAERFIADPFSAQVGARLYRTGDLVRWRSDGNLEFLGRMDQQVKVRGFRIEPGEIESVLRENPWLSSCAVLTQRDGGKEMRLIAFVVPRNGRALLVDELGPWLAQKLPDYMIPSRFVVMDALPLMPNGKLDRKALEKMEGAMIAGGISYVAPPTDLERQLTAIWQGVLRQERIGIRDNFFSLGGHSLQAVHLTAEIEKRLGCKLAAAVLFQAPTVEGLARHLTEERWASSFKSVVSLQPLGSKPPLFFVHGLGGDVYRYLKLSQLLSSDQPVYGIQAVGLDGKTKRHTTVEEMAAHYVQEIRSFQPEGPYFLGGYSMGGLIAFEVAQQLHRLGQHVALLALLDSAPIGVIPWRLYSLRMATYIPGRCLYHFRRWWQMPVGERLSYLQGRWAALRFWMSTNRSKPPVVTAPPEPASQVPQVPGFEDYYHAVASAYKLDRYPGTVDVFVSDDAQLYWKRYWKCLAGGGARFHRISGGHLQIFSADNMPVLAKSLSTVLLRAQGEHRASSTEDNERQ